MRERSRLERLATAVGTLRLAVLESSAATPVELRRSAYDGSAPDGAIGEYVRLVEQHAYRVTDDQVTALRKEGMSDDGVFDLTVAAALGAAQRRLEDGLALLDSAGS